MKHGPQPQPVTMLMLTPEQLGTIVEQAVARAVAGHDDEPMTLREFARHMKASTKTIERKVKRGEIVPCSTRPLRFLRSSIGDSRGR